MAQNEDKGVGAVIVFQPHVTKEEAEKLIQKHLGDVIDGHAQVCEFNPEWGGPVWYVP